MSFFSKLLGRFFMQKSTPARPLNSKEKRKKVPSNSEFKDSGYPENTLGYLFKETSKSVYKTYNYNFLNPPKLSADALQKLRKRINEIPPMPEIWHKIQTILQQPDSSASDLGACIAQDPILTAQVLKVCNSSAYGAKNSSEITNIPLAIARLGLDEVSTIIFRSLAPDMGVSELARKEVNDIWFHSQAIASLIRILVEPSQKVPRHEANLLGMLHDIGKLVILHGESEATLTKLKASMVAGASSLDAEYAVLGYTHIDAGMMLALHWKLPPYIQKIISHHHHPDVVKAVDLPESTKYSMMTLHIAHLVLQHHMLSLGDHSNASIWACHKRSCQQTVLLFGRDQLALPLENVSFYKQLQLELTRVQLSFPDLFPPS